MLRSIVSLILAHANIDVLLCRALVKLDESVGYELKQDYPIDEPVGDEAQIKVSAVSICGSDINLWKWNETAKVIAALPFIPGHEAVGIVVKTGPESKGNQGSAPFLMCLSDEQVFKLGKQQALVVRHLYLPIPRIKSRRWTACGRGESLLL